MKSRFRSSRKFKSSLLTVPMSWFRTKPKTSLGLENYPASKKEVTDIVAEVWQNLDGKKVTEVSYGKGKLYWTRDPIEVLKKMGVEPDVIVEAEGETEEQSSYRAKLPLTYIHRYTPEADFFFVASSVRKSPLRACSVSASAENNRSSGIPIAGASKNVPFTKKKTGAPSSR